MNHYARLLVGLALSGSSDAFFSMLCAGRITRERLDPVVNPGKVAGHVHTIAGGNGFSANMTFEDARASTCSSCPPKADLSNYWTPQLYVKLKDGSGFRPVPLVGDPSRQGPMTIYYLDRPSGDTLVPFPPDFRMLAGDTFKRSPGSDLASQAISFRCLGTSPELVSPSIPNVHCPNGLRAQINFPACWDGKNLDSADHKSHMSYPVGLVDNGPCPASHPKHFMSLFYEVLYDIEQFRDEWVDGKHPFVFANGDATGYGFHGDFVNGWDTSVFQKVIDTCSGDDGLIQHCKALTLYTDDEMRACKVPTTVDEKVDGKLAKLPGCNPVTYGPDRALPPTSQNCNDTVTFGPGSPGNKDLSSIGWKYAGCGTDNTSGRALQGAMTASTDMTVESCVSFCSGQNYKYAGLEYSRECFCASSLAPGYVIGQGGAQCNMECAGEEGTWCGGSNALSVYQKQTVQKRVRGQKVEVE